jgi:MFS family permease
VYGRKSLIIFGLLVLGVLTAASGFVRNYWIALGLRVIAGLCDSTQSVAYAAIGDLATREDRQMVRMRRDAPPPWRGGSVMTD